LVPCAKTATAPQRKQAAKKMVEKILFILFITDSFVETSVE
jgi:hypothetical protein